MGKTNQPEAKTKTACVEIENSPIPGLSNEHYQQFLDMFAPKGTPTKTEATDQITHRLNWFNNDLKYTRELPVTIPNGSTIPVEGRGSCTLPNGINIKNVLLVPKFTCNLLSVSCLSKDLQCAVTFFPNFCVMQDLSSMRLIAVGECKEGLLNEHGGKKEERHGS